MVFFSLSEMCVLTVSKSICLRICLNEHLDHASYKTVCHQDRGSERVLKCCPDWQPTRFWNRAIISTWIILHNCDRDFNVVLLICLSLSEYTGSSPNSLAAYLEASHARQHKYSMQQNDAALYTANIWQHLMEKTISECIAISQVSGEISFLDQVLQRIDIIAPSH